MTDTISSSDAAAPLASYSQAVVAGDLMFVSGQIPINPATGELINSAIETATEQSLLNVQRILQAAGLELSHVVKSSVFLINTEDYPGMDATYKRIMPEPFPAREAIFIAGLPKSARIEISVIAHTQR